MSLEDLEKTYNQARAGNEYPDWALMQIPGLGCVELCRGGAMQMNGRNATMIEWHMVRGWLKQRKCESELKKLVIPSPVSPPAEGDALKTPAT